MSLPDDNKKIICKILCRCKKELKKVVTRRIARDVYRAIKKRKAVLDKFHDGY